MTVQTASSGNSPARTESPPTECQPQPDTPQCDTTDPFYNTTETLSMWNKIKFIFPGVILIPIRLVGLVASLVFVTVVSVLCFKLGHTEDSTGPPKPFRGPLAKVMHYLSSWGCRAVLFFCGFHRIKVTGKPASSTQAPIVVCNHSGPFECFALSVYHHVTYVSRHENKTTPLIGPSLIARQVIFVDRNDAESRHTVADEVIRRSKEPGWPALVVFPEGTLTNNRSLLAFRTGAFQPGVPVQPVVVKYPFKHMDPSYVGTNLNIGTLILRLQSQWYNTMELEFLPVYTPSDLEQQNVQLFTENVQRSMSTQSGIPISIYNVEDYYLTCNAQKMMKGKAKGGTVIPTSDAIVGMERLKRETGLGVGDVTKAMHLFVELGADAKGKLSTARLTQALDLPDTFLAKGEGPLGGEQLIFRDFLAWSVVLDALKAVKGTPEDLSVSHLRAALDQPRGPVTHSDCSGGSSPEEKTILQKKHD